MNWKRQQELFKVMVKEEMDLLNKKGAEYASDADALANFKRQAEAWGVSPLVVLGIFMDKHYSAVQSYVRKGGKIVSNEPIEGRVNDLRNYAFLLLALIEDLKASEPKNETPSV